MTRADQKHEPSESRCSMRCSLRSTQLPEQQAPEPQEQPATQLAGHHHKTHAKRTPTPSFQMAPAALLVFLCLAVVARSPSGYHGDGVIDPANTDAGAGQDEQDPSEAHPDTLSFQNPSAALLDHLLLPNILLHGGIGLEVGASTMACAPPHKRAFPSVAAKACTPVN